MYKYVLLLHIIGATVWTGGHLILACTVLPGALKSRSVEAIINFESAFEKIGIPALILQIFTGVWLAGIRLPDMSLWIDLDNLYARLLLLKAGLLLITVLLALHARLKIIPGLTVQTLPLLAGHIIGVTVISVLFVWVGVAFRTGGFF